MLEVSGSITVRNGHDADGRATLLEDAVAQCHPDPVVLVRHAVGTAGEVAITSSSAARTLPTFGLFEHVGEHGVHHVQVVDDRGGAQDGSTPVRARSTARAATRWGRCAAACPPPACAGSDRSRPSDRARGRRRPSAPAARPRRAGASATPTRSLSAAGSSSSARPARAPRSTSTGGRKGWSCPSATSGSDDLGTAQVAVSGFVERLRSARRRRRWRGSPALRVGTPACGGPARPRAHPARRSRLGVGVRARRQAAGRSAARHALERLRFADLARVRARGRRRARRARAPMPASSA